MGVEGTNTVGEVKTVVGEGTGSVAEGTNTPVKDFLSRTDLGHFSASLETNNVAYVKDQKLGFRIGVEAGLAVSTYCRDGAVAPYGLYEHWLEGRCCGGLHCGCGLRCCC